MRGYSMSGFGTNFCTENKANWNDMLEDVCFWGAIVGGTAVTIAAGPGAPLVGYFRGVNVDFACIRV